MVTTLSSSASTTQGARLIIANEVQTTSANTMLNTSDLKPRKEEQCSPISSSIPSETLSVPEAPIGNSNPWWSFWS